MLNKFLNSIAYLTNPSETSFRAFLTEQAFRHHLSKLDDADADAQEDELEAASTAVRSDALLRRGLSNSHKHRSVTYASPPFAFANRASVSLRTPKHMFRSFGVLSIAAVIPTSSKHSRQDKSQDDGDGVSFTTDDDNVHESSTLMWDSWFVGAFGMWFWAVNLDGFWRESGFIARDETDGAATGVLEVKALDRSDSLNRAC